MIITLSLHYRHAVLLSWDFSVYTESRLYPAEQTVCGCSGVCLPVYIYHKLYGYNYTGQQHNLYMIIIVHG